MVTIKRRIVVSLLALCLFCIFSITAFAADPVIPRISFEYKGTDAVAGANSPYRSNKAFFRDEAEVLTTVQQKNIWEKVQATAESTRINIALFLGSNYRTDPETENFTYDCAAALFGVNSDTLFIYLDFEGYSPAYDYIRALNKAENIYNQNTINKILQAMYQYFPKSGEPIYSDNVSKGLLKGLDEVTAQANGYSQNPGTNNMAPQNQTQPQQHSKVTEPQTPWNIPVYVFYFVGIVLFLVVIWILSSIVRFIGRLFSRGSSYNGGSYYNNNDYYRHSGSYYGGHSSYRHHRRPPPPPHRSSPSRSSHRSSSGSSSHSSGPSSSGSGHHR